LTATHDGNSSSWRSPATPACGATDAALAAQQLDRLDDHQFTPYQLTGDDISALRERFASWPRDPASDLEAHAAHKAVPAASPTAAERAAAGFPTAIADPLQQPTLPYTSPTARPTQQPSAERPRRRT
jgi:hypothetical protein